MTRILHTIITSLAMILACSSCTNGGDIGTLYGMWLFDEATVDGEPVEADLEQYSISFQSNVVRLIHTYDHNEFVSNMGFWERDGSDLQLDLSSQSADWFFFRPIGFEPGVMRMTIESESSHSLHLRYVDPQGRTFRYNLRKSL